MNYTGHSGHIPGRQSLKKARNKTGQTCASQLDDFTTWNEVFSRMADLGEHTENRPVTHGGGVEG